MDLRCKIFSPMKLVRTIKMYFNVTCSKVCIDKKVSDAFSIQNGLKQEMQYRHCFSALL